MISGGVSLEFLARGWRISVYVPDTVHESENKGEKECVPVQETENLSLLPV